MTTKTILYIIFVPIVLWALDAININSIFKKNRIYQARTFYIIIVLSLTYMSSSFIISFLTSLKQEVEIY